MLVQAQIDYNQEVLEWWFIISSSLKTEQEIDYIIGRIGLEQKNPFKTTLRHEKF